MSKKSNGIISKVARKHGLKLYEVTDRVGLSVSAMSEYNRQIKYPKVDVLFDIADAIGCNVDELFNEYKKELRIREDKK